MRSRRSRLLVLLFVLAAAIGGIGVVEAQDLEERAFDHLLKICTKLDGTPNPRHTCTEGYKEASNYVNQIMQESGLVPLGNSERTSYRQVIPGSMEPTYCPHGMINHIGMIEGSKFPDEYIVYLSKLDGPHNDNPQTFITRGTPPDVCNA